LYLESGPTNHLYFVSLTDGLRHEVGHLSLLLLLLMLVQILKTLVLNQFHIELPGASEPKSIIRIKG
jgi:hypothetical protein